MSHVRASIMVRTLARSLNKSPDEERLLLRSDADGLPRLRHFRRHVDAGDAARGRNGCWRGRRIQWPRIFPAPLLKASHLLLGGIWEFLQIGGPCLALKNSGAPIIRTPTHFIETVIWAIIRR